MVSRVLSPLPFLQPSFSLLLPRLKGSSLPFRPFSASTPYPLYYELVRYRPSRRHSRRRPESSSSAAATVNGEGSCEPSSVDISQDSERMDRAKRRYYRKRQKRMYGGSDSESDSGRRSSTDDFVELKPEIVDFHRLHAREQEIYFYDAFAFPWEKDKHYRMVYQLEKKYFPEYSLDKAFVDPGAEPSLTQPEASQLQKKKGKRLGKNEKRKRLGKNDEEGNRDRAMMFFEEKDREEEKKDGAGDVSAKKDSVGDVSEKKVEDFFRCLKKVPNAKMRSPVVASEVIGEPFLSSRSRGLPARWDEPSGTVILVNKPKGWTSFTVCGKLRRLVNVQKVGHAGTLDPMATGLLIVCVGKATKLVERYQCMLKSYSGIFRLGEATSTWDADSPVIQREPWEHIKSEDIRKAATSFVGEIWQVPPMFSAIKVAGEKMYDKARRGEMIELSPRRITIFEFDVERSLEDRQNIIFRVSCSKGTYIRSLCADFGKALGSCAHVTALRRDSIGEHTADDAWVFSDLEDQIKKAYL